METIPWYKSETLVANLMAIALFGLGLVQQAIRDGVDLSGAESWAYIVGLVITFFTFVQRMFFTTKVVEQSANRAGGR